MMKDMLLVSIIAALAIPLFSQSRKFDVASIKSDPLGGPQIFIDARPGTRFVGTNVPVRQLLRQAFRPLQDDQIVGGPDWMNSDRFDIEAKAEQRLTQAEMAEALRSLLEDRFQLKTHRDMKELPVYLLTVAKGGPKVRLVNPPSPLGGATNGGPGYLKNTAMQMAALVTFLSSLLGRPVVNRTDLSGFYDIELHYAPDQVRAGDGQPTTNDSPTMFTALQEQLGLRLEAGRAVMDVLVVDSVSKPTEN